MSVTVQLESFDPGQEQQKLLDQIAADKGNITGGVTAFTGYVRDFAGDSNVSAMTLEHYPGMTERMLEKIEAEALARWPLDGTRIIHRYGRLEPGDPIVLVLAASAHRQAAFEACHFLIDWLKTKAPFWKKEETAEGNQWVDAKSSDDDAAAAWDQKG